jgi:hypothetical protein
MPRYISLIHSRNAENPSKLISQDLFIPFFTKGFRKPFLGASAHIHLANFQNDCAKSQWFRHKSRRLKRD